jgi:ABC-type lipoprotein export system ATPase subunit
VTGAPEVRKALEARGLRKTYRQGTVDVHAVDGVDLAIEAGELVAIVGRSGSGKTTLLDLLGCLLRPTSGEVLVGGEPTAGLPDARLAAVRRDRIGFVFQEFNLLPTLTALENVLLPRRYGARRPDDRARAEALLAAVDLSHRARHRPGQLSGGEQQRVAIARALVNDPAIILADEPTGELDTETSEALVAMLRRLNRDEGRTIVIVTHDPEVAAAADRIVRLQDGRVVADERR